MVGLAEFFEISANFEILDRFNVLFTFMVIMLCWSLELK